MGDNCDCCSGNEPGMQSQPHPVEQAPEPIRMTQDPYQVEASVAGGDLVLASKGSCEGFACGNCCCSRDNCDCCSGNEPGMQSQPHPVEHAPEPIRMTQAS